MTVLTDDVRTALTAGRLAGLLPASADVTWQTGPTPLDGLDIPARQSFLLEMVGSREDLPNAIALNSSIFSAARLIGPAVAGFVISAAGEGVVILVNGLSYIAGFIAAWAIMKLIARRGRSLVPPHRCFDPITPTPLGTRPGGRWSRCRCRCGLLP